MKIAPVSGDMVVKLAAIGAALAAAFWGWGLLKAAVPSAGQAAQAVNPLNPNNVFAGAANSAASTLSGQPNTLGGWIYDLTHTTPSYTAPAAPVYVDLPPLDATPTYDPLGNRTN